MTRSPQGGWTETEPGSGVYQCDQCGIRVPMQPSEWPIHHTCGAAATKPKPPPCVFLGDMVDEIAYTSRCGQPARARVYECEKLGRCLRRPVRDGAADGLAVCAGCGEG